MDKALAAGHFKGWKACFFGGVIFVILGILVLSVPEFVSVAFTLILAWLLLIGGIVQLFMTLKNKKGVTYYFSLISSIVLIILGSILLFKPVYALITLTFLFSIYLLVQGILQISIAFSMRPLKYWVWMLFSGIFAILLACVIWIKWPVSAVSFLGIVIGIYLLVWGVAEILLAWSMRALQQ